MRIQRVLMAMGLLVLAQALTGMSCSDGGDGKVLYADAEYDPDASSDTSVSIHEGSLSVAQTFTLLGDGKFERFQLVVTQGAAGSSGTIRVDVRPLLGTGEPETTDANSIIDPIDVDTTTLPGTLVDDFTVFDVGDQPDRQVLAGQQYAIVVTFLSRAAGNLNDPIAIVLGRTGDEYADGSGSTDPDGMGFTNNAFDYFFRTFVLR